MSRQILFSRLSLRWWEKAERKGAIGFYVGSYWAKIIVKCPNVSFMDYCTMGKRSSSAWLFDLHSSPAFEDLKQISTIDLNWLCLPSLNHLAAFAHFCPRWSVPPYKVAQRIVSPKASRNSKAIFLTALMRSLNRPLRSPIKLFSLLCLAHIESGTLAPLKCSIGPSLARKGSTAKSKPRSFFFVFKNSPARISDAEREQRNKTA